MTKKKGEETVPNNGCSGNRKRERERGGEGGEGVQKNFISIFLFFCFFFRYGKTGSVRCVVWCCVVWGCRKFKSHAVEGNISVAY